MPTADPPTDPYESLDTEQRNRAIALKTARDVLRSTAMFSPAAPIPADAVIQVAEYIVTGRTDRLSPLLLPMTDGDTQTLPPTYVFVGEPDEAVPVEPHYTDDQLREAGPNDA